MHAHGANAVPVFEGLEAAGRVAKGGKTGLQTANELDSVRIWSVFLHHCIKENKCRIT